MRKTNWKKILVGKTMHHVVIEGEDMDVVEVGDVILELEKQIERAKKERKV